jgi:hypothetical protein
MLISDGNDLDKTSTQHKYEECCLNILEPMKPMETKYSYGRRHLILAGCSLAILSSNIIIL